MVCVTVVEGTTRAHTTPVPNGPGFTGSCDRCLPFCCRRADYTSVFLDHLIDRAKVAQRFEQALAAAAKA